SLAPCGQYGARKTPRDPWARICSSASRGCVSTNSTAARPPSSATRRSFPRPIQKTSTRSCCMQSSLYRSLLACCTVLLASSAYGAGDAARGMDVFKTECSECHSAKEGKNKKGPSLFAIVNRSAAALHGVKYSDALKSNGWTWSEEQLRAYLSRPVSQSNP